MQTYGDRHVGLGIDYSYPSGGLDDDPPPGGSTRTTGGRPRTAMWAG
ncbi:MAG: hypothetical protein R3D25_21130 [Geminicoccaceae bacterium]